MPFSRKLAFIKEELPSGIKDHDLVFYCEPTDEAFIHYEDFCERVIQCNSLVWTDTVSGKSDLTYLEALESEEKSTQILKSLPDTLHIPTLYLASRAQNTSFENLLNDVYGFVKDRFFKGETVMYITLHDEIWREGVVTKVIAPSDEEVKEIRSYVELSKGVEFYPPPSLYLYEVERKHKGEILKNTLSIPCIKRHPGIWTKDKASVFLQHFTECDEDKWGIERGVIEKFHVPLVKFDDFYDGIAPLFPLAEIMEDSAQLTKAKEKALKKSSSSKHDTPNKKLVKDKKHSAKSDNVKTIKQRKEVVSSSSVSKVSDGQKKKLQQTDIKNYFMSSQVDSKVKKGKSVKEYQEITLNSSHDEDDEAIDLLWSHITEKVSTAGFSSDKTDTQEFIESNLQAAPGTSSGSDINSYEPFSGFIREVRVHKKRKQTKLTGDGQIEGMKKHKKLVQGGSQASSSQKAKKEEKARKEREDEKVRKEVREQKVLEGFKLHEERLKLKAKHEEEKLQFAKFMKEWRKKREDLECEDLKPLPVPSKINCRIPNHLFGDFMAVLEFFHSFHDYLKVKSFIPGGVSFDVLERALVEEEIAGPLNDILSILLTTLFDLQLSENEKPKIGVPISVDLNLDDLFTQKMSYQEAIPLCIAATGWSDTFQGSPIQDLELNPTSISEILRLHLLGSGGRAWDVSSKWLSQRGGHTNFDDPGLWLRVDQTSVLLNLSYHHICELPIEDKITILSCLTNQVLTYARVRDLLDVRGEQMRQAKAEVRALEISELKLEKEATTKRMQKKREAKLLRLKGESPGKASTLLLKHQKEAEIEKLKMEKEISKLKADIQKKHSRVLPLVMNYQLHPLGCDRAHRNFWMFASIPGLFIESSLFELGPCLPQATPLKIEDRDDVETHVRKLFEEGQNCSSDKENDVSDGEITRPIGSPNKKMLSEQNVSIDQTSCDKSDKDLHQRESEERNLPQREFLVCTASDKCPVHGCFSSKSKWSFFSDEDDVTALLESLNERGIRESELKRVIMREQEIVRSSISSCPFHKLNACKFPEQEPRKATRSSLHYKMEEVNMKYPPGTPIRNIMESVLRESILEMENKITIGCVGMLKVQDRMAWRMAIENRSYDKQCERLVWGFRSHTSFDKELKELPTEKKDSDDESDLDKGMKKGQDIENNENSDSEKGQEDTHREKEDDEDSEEEIDRKQCIGKDVHKWGGFDDEMNASIEPKGLLEINMKTTNAAKLSEEKMEMVEFESTSGTKVIDSKEPQPGPKTPISLNPGSNLSGNIMEESVLTSDVEENVNNHSSEPRVGKAPPPRDPVIKDLACAILQLGQSIDQKFLQKPLSGTGSSTARKQMKYWEVSLMNTINFSQLFIHHLTLDYSINWSKSVLRASCRICRKRGDPECMFTCLTCNKRCHFVCAKLDIGLSDTDLYCLHCLKESERPLRNIKKRKIDSEMPADQEVEQSTNQEVLRNNSPERKLKKLMCKICGDSDDSLVVCTSCSVAYHANCLNPPLRSSRRQKENWQCHSCKEISSDYVDAVSSCDAAVEDDITSGRERRVCASATIAKIASYAKRLRSCSWDDEGEASSHYSDSSQDCEGSRDYSPSPHSLSREHSPIRRSSRRSDCISDYLPLDNAVLQHLLDEMIHHKDSWPFLRPVRKSEVPDYHLYIKKPMDLGTIKYKLNTSEYKNNYDFVADTLLVFENCFMYNSSVTAVYKCGLEMLKFFKQRCKELGLVVVWADT